MNTSRRIISFILALTMIFTLGATAFAGSDDSGELPYDEYVAEGYKVCDDPSDMLSYVLIDGHEAAPVRIVKATLKQDGKTTNAYLIGLVGIETQKHQVNVFANAVPSALNIENDYTIFVKQVLADNVPKGANIIFCGHSLGGMVAQQLIADPEVKDNYNIIATLTAGSPYIITRGREGALNRICDKYDCVPYLSAATLFMPVTQVKTQIAEDGGYFFDPNGAHNYSYRREAVWGRYDALGNADGDAVITFNYSSLMTFGRIPND